MNTTASMIIMTPIISSLNGCPEEPREPPLKNNNKLFIIVRIR